jgi:hypothetical protein
VVLVVVDHLRSEARQGLVATLLTAVAAEAVALARTLAAQAATAATAVTVLSS